MAGKRGDQIAAAGWVTPALAAKRIGITRRTLAAWRSEPPVKVLGPYMTTYGTLTPSVVDGRVLYRDRDVAACQKSRIAADHAKRHQRPVSVRDLFRPKPGKAWADKQEKNQGSIDRDAKASQLRAARASAKASRIAQDEQKRLDRAKTRAAQAERNQAERQAQKARAEVARLNRQAKAASAQDPTVTQVRAERAAQYMVRQEAKRKDQETKRKERGKIPA